METTAKKKQFFTRRHEQTHRHTISQKQKSRKKNFNYCGYLVAVIMIETNKSKMEMIKTIEWAKPLFVEL